MEIFCCRENCNLGTFSNKKHILCNKKIATFKPEDDIINIETGRNDNKKTLIINKMSTREEFMYIWLYRCYLKDEYAAYFLLATEVGFFNVGVV